MFVGLFIFMPIVSIIASLIVAHPLVLIVFPLSILFLWFCIIKPIGRAFKNRPWKSSIITIFIAIGIPSSVHGIVKLNNMITEKIAVVSYIHKETGRLAVFVHEFKNENKCYSWIRYSKDKLNTTDNNGWTTIYNNCVMNIGNITKENSIIIGNNIQEMKTKLKNRKLNYYVLFYPPMP